MPSSPWAKTITAPTTAATLFSVMQAKDAGLKGQVTPQRCAKLSIEWDPGNTTQIIYVGNDDVTTTNFGKKLSAAGQIFNIESTDQDIINLDSIFLLGSAAAANVDVTVVWK